MAYGHAVLGESLEACREAVEWGKLEQIRLDKNRAASLYLKDLILGMKAERKKSDRDREER